MTTAAPDPGVLARWRLTPGPLLGARSTLTWSVTRAGRPFVLQRLNPADSPDWRYPLRVAAALRARGWPTPDPAEAPLPTPDGVWLLCPELPGRPLISAGPGSAEQQRARGRLLAELHHDLAATGITEQCGGYHSPADVVADPELDRTLRSYEMIHPVDGGLLRRCREAAAEWFATHPTDAAPRSVIHGDFAPWNLLYDNGRLTGLLDFEFAHHTFQVADFALAWRGYQDPVIDGYHQVRPLSELERRLIRPVFHAWLFLGIAGADPATLDLTWNVAHLRKHSAR
ncbi:phosphotransferase [Actinoplanes palleronii]|uniref:Aminoglycoside phosphotransferase domain-containing protein n=1 Tax=Actinoplanes palleronii TaxID=113570 RepID=A0ABQ4BHZ6_9ACTN|nr:phosphotransferase [Actinoplanes palleronii]GIE70309.1 hypothetical protein Apa02nite_064170 [Actinoplanes palleronii]